MPRFSNKSDLKLDTCHSLLQELFRDVIKEYDCAILRGHRGRRLQNIAFKNGASTKKWPDSNHNVMPSLAVDAAPYIKGKGIIEDRGQCAFFAAKVKAKAAELGIQVRWGGDWDGDGDLTDQTFNDLWHWELISTEKTTQTSGGAT
ncbi:MAG: hypothetical protein KOO65_05295 [Desulfobacterales bacterium]|nr:hypothetical protein [Desulfobacterales bacterium]